MRILLERSDLNPNTADEYGQTPLSRAAENGLKEIVGILLKWNDINVDITDHNGQTSAEWAAQNGYGRIAELLRDRAASTPRYAASLQPAATPSPEPSESFEPPPKRIRRF